MADETRSCGVVNFPIGNPQWQDTGEDGLVVKLVVCPRDYDEYGSGAHVADLCTLPLVGDDRRPMMMADNKRAWEEYHFPNINNEECQYQLLSRPYLAVIVLGITTWSGWSETAGRYWSCTYDDLTDEGRTLYKQVQAMYPGCDLHLLTFLDT